MNDDELIAERDEIIFRLTAELAAARETLRRTVLWAECCAGQLNPDQRRVLNWTRLNEARGVLAAKEAKP